jgi:hypothetical protein
MRNADRATCQHSNAQFVLQPNHFHFRGIDCSDGEYDDNVRGLNRAMDM